MMCDNTSRVLTLGCVSRWRCRCDRVRVLTMTLGLVVTWARELERCLKPDLV